MKTRAELLEVLDSVSAAAETMLAVLVSKRLIGAEDLLHRTAIVDEARALCDAELRGDDLFVPADAEVCTFCDGCGWLKR